MSASKVWTDILQNFSVADLLEEDFELKQVETTTTLPETLDLLTRNNIQCVPVWDNNAGSYVGLIDILDILSVIILTSDCKGLVDIASHNTATWEAFWAQENEVIRTFPASELCNTSTRNPWVPIDIGTPLADVLAMFGRGVGLKRVPVIDGDGFMRGFVTQSGITKWLHNSLDLLNADVLSKKISDCAHLGSTDVKTVASDSITLDAFKTIVTQKISALAVVNSAGVLIGCISGSDLKGSEGLNLFKDLSKPVSEYLMISTEKFKRDNALHPISVQEDATVGDILKHIAAHKVHRVFVVDKDTKPTKVISLTDLLEFFRNEH